MEADLLAAVAQEVEPLLGDEGRLLSVPSCLSTNNLVRDFVLGGQAPPIVIAVTAEQTGGRGRRGRVWFQQPGKDIACSLGFQLAHFGYALTTRYPLVAGVLIAHAVESICRMRLNLKWPNDLMLHGKKTGGILVVSSRGYLITGIGINVNSHPEQFPREVAQRATSLSHEAARELPLSELIVAMVREFLAFFKDGGAAEASLMDEWVERSITLGRRVKLSLVEGIRELNALDINRETGELICEDDEGNLMSVSLGEVMD
ncbi:MAG: biotin--[acetyl-CoA-carboxylase] ligase [Planctomycetales bacterium 4484_113]|nr:MAG: biotin--[acetyl-CoA-carboxylase] ligase [Planctomycetales bacterium 4484_113]